MSKLRTTRSAAKSSTRGVKEERGKRSSAPSSSRSSTMKFSPTVLALSRVPRKRVEEITTSIFAPYEPHPGVVPVKKNLLANDAAIQKTSTWSAGAMDDKIIFAGGWAGSWGGGYGAFSEGQAFLGYPYLSELAQRPEYRVMADTLATESTRKWIRFTASGSGAAANSKSDKIKALEAEFKRLKVQEAFQKVDTLDSYFGRGHLYLDFNDSTDKPDELKTPVGDGQNIISESKIAVGSFKRIQVVEPVWSYPTNYNSNNPLRPDWYRPELWFAMGTEVHSSRFLTFISREVPDILKPAYSFGGLSLSQMAKPYVDNWLRTRQSVSDLLHSFTVWCLATNMGETLTPGGEELFGRIAIFNNLRDNKGMFMTDKDTEELSNISVPLSGLDVLQAQAQEQMCSVSQIPLVKFTGISPAGLNASSEGEIRVFYDMIGARQRKFYSPNLDRIFRFAQINIWGAVDPDISYEFEELWSLDDKQRAEVRKIDADTDAVLLDAGAIDAEEIRARVAADRNSPHASLDLNKVIEPPEEPEPNIPGIGAGQGGGLGSSKNEFQGAET